MKVVYSLLRVGEEEALSNAEKVIRYIDGVFDENPTVESLVVIPVDRKNRPLGRITVSVGTATGALVSPGEIFKACILSNATGFFLAHNHPSGDPAPSKSDEAVTEQMLLASKVMGINMLDHVIVGHSDGDPKGKGFYSFNYEGVL